MGSRDTNHFKYGEDFESGETAKGTAIMLKVLRTEVVYKHTVVLKPN